MSGKVIAVVNEKGGVGKTTCSVQIGLELAEKGFKVCIVDNDPSGDATTALLGNDIPSTISNGNQPSALANSVKLYTAESEFAPHTVNFKNTYDISLMGATDALSLFKGADLEPAYEFCESLNLLAEKFDFIIIDCPPSFGLLFTAAIFASVSGGVLIPTTPDDLAFKAAKKVQTRIAQMNTRMSLGINIIGFLCNKVVNNPMPQSVRHYIDSMKEEFGDKVFNTQIHQTVKISDSIALQEKISTYAKSNSKAVLQIASTTNELLARLEKM